MKTIFAFLLVAFFSASADDQFYNSRPLIYPSRHSQGYRPYGYAVPRGNQTYYFRSGSRQPCFWTYSNRSYGRPATHVFQGNRYRGSVYGR